MSWINTGFAAGMVKEVVYSRQRSQPAIGGLLILQRHFWILPTELKVMISAERTELSTNCLLSMISLTGRDAGPLWLRSEIWPQPYPQLYPNLCSCNLQLMLHTTSMPKDHLDLSTVLFTGTVASIISIV